VTVRVQLNSRLGGEVGFSFWKFDCLVEQCGGGTKLGLSPPPPPPPPPPPAAARYHPSTQKAFPRMFVFYLPYQKSPKADFSTLLQNLLQVDTSARIVVRGMSSIEGRD